MNNDIAEKIEKHMRELTVLMNAARDEQRRFTPFILFMVGFLVMTNFLFILACAIMIARHWPY